MKITVLFCVLLNAMQLDSFRLAIFVLKPQIQVSGRYGSAMKLSNNAVYRTNTPTALSRISDSTIFQLIKRFDYDENFRTALAVVASIAVIVIYNVKALFDYRLFWTPSKDASADGYQTFQCEICDLELHPAKGRAKILMGREGFKCPRCGAVAASFFDINDLTDPRAVAKKEQLERELKEELEDVDGDVNDSNDTNDRKDGDKTKIT